MSTPEGLELLLAERAIRDVVSRYARGVDRLDLEMIRDCYWPEATDVHGTFTGRREEFVEWAGKVLRRHTMTMHKVGPALIDWHGDVAAVETYCMAFHCGEPAGDPKFNNVAGVRYVDRFECRDGEWRIADRTTVVEWVTPWQRDAEMSDRFAGLASRDTSDPVYSVLATGPGNGGL